MDCLAPADWSFVPPPLSLGSFEGRVMRADIPQQDPTVDLFERKANCIGSAAFPDTFGSLDALDAERGMRRIGFVKNERLRESFAVLTGEFLRGSLEASGPLEDHRCKSVTSALADRKRFVRPRRMSSCASRSPRCHSSVQKYACDASTRLFLRRTISLSSRTSARKTSPSLARMRRRRSAGRVIWPLRRRVRIAGVFDIRTG